MGPSSQAAPAFVRLAGHPLRWRLLTELAGSDLRVRELASVAGQPQNLVSYHLRLLRDGGLVAATRSSFDGRESYYRLDLAACARALADAGAAVHPALRPGLTAPGLSLTAPGLSARGLAAPGRTAPSTGATGSGGSRPRRSRIAVLFVCTGNSARSPIAEALLRHHAAGHAAGHVEAVSAGSHPKASLHADAVRVLRDGFGIDIDGQRPRHLHSLTGRRFDYVITLCDKAREVCPDFGSRARRAHWSIPDPAATGTGYEGFARAAAGIDTRVRQLLPVLDTTQWNEG